MGQNRETFSASENRKLPWCFVPTVHSCSAYTQELKAPEQRQRERFRMSILKLRSSYNSYIHRTDQIEVTALGGMHTSETSDAVNLGQL